MAKKSDDSDKKVTRVKASQTSKKAKSAKPAKKSQMVSTPDPIDAPKKGVFGRILGYFTGAWYELRQVRWPNRRATWALTLAVILFALFFVVFILLLDAGFKYLFEQLLK